MDHGLLNKITKNDGYEIPIIQEYFDGLINAIIISIIDPFSGYHQIPMFKDDQELTTFTTKFAYYYLKLMLFGLTNTPTSFRHKMRSIFFDVIDKCVEVYLDDIIVFSSSIKQYLIYQMFLKYRLKII